MKIIKTYANVVEMVDDICQVEVGAHAEENQWDMLIVGVDLTNDGWNGSTSGTFIIGNFNIDIVVLKHGQSRVVEHRQGQTHRFGTKWAQWKHPASDVENG